MYLDCFRDGRASAKRNVTFETHLSENRSISGHVIDTVVCYVHTNAWYVYKYKYQTRTSQWCRYVIAAYGWCDVARVIRL